MPVQVLLITGTIAVGKSTVAAEINDTLAGLKVSNAAVDLDALSWQWPPGSRWNSDLMFENLAALWPNYAARGAGHFVLAGVLEDRADLERYRVAVPGADITVCRLVAPDADRIDRLLARMPPGPSRDWHLARTVELHRILERLAVEDFIVDNGARPVRRRNRDPRPRWLDLKPTGRGRFGLGRLTRHPPRVTEGARSVRCVGLTSVIVLVIVMQCRP